MPEVIHEHEEVVREPAGSSALGVIVGAIIVILILLAIWWFGFGPAHSTSTAPGGAPAISAPAVSLPAPSVGGGAASSSP